MRLSRSRCDRGHEQSTRCSPRDSSSLRGSLNHDFIAAYFDRLLRFETGKWVRKGLRNSDELPAAREPCQPAFLPWHHLTQAPPTPPLRGPWHLVFSRNTHCYSEMTLLTDVHLSYCLSQFINTARRTLNKCNRSKVFPNLSILVQTLSLSKYDDIASYLIKDILC